MGILDNPILAWYMGIIHFVPFLTTCSELAMTDMALEKSHWKIAYFTMCPCYMVCNWFGSVTNENLLKQNPNGSVYQVEQWITHPVYTIILFMIMGFVQGGLYYCFASIVERCWPKREAEYFDKVES